MRVRVQLFAVARERAGREAIEVDLPAGANVAALREALATAEPVLADLVPHLHVAINSAYAADDALLPADAEIACIPPVSGG